MIAQGNGRTARKSCVTDSTIIVEPVSGKKGRAEFVDLGRSFADRLPHSVPQLRSEQLELIDPGKNPFFGLACAPGNEQLRLRMAKKRIPSRIDQFQLF